MAASRDFASVVALRLLASNAHGDALELLRRRREMNLAAELRWALLPPRSFVNDDVSIAGVLEPAYHIAGDCFDYAVGEASVDLAVFDAMGHGLEASRLANLALVAYRHSRRQRFSLNETVEAMDTVMKAQFGPERFTTALLARLDLTRGVLELLNCGHPRPLLVRRD